MSLASSWMKDVQDRVKRASHEVSVALQPRMEQAKRSLEASIQQMGLKPGREIFQDDEQLQVALEELEHLRVHLTTISASVEQHRTRLIQLATTQKQLADNLAAPSEQILVLFRKHHPASHLNAQLSLGNAQMNAANALSRFALDMATPMADLSRTFEESYIAKIMPLRKRYTVQKSEYLKYLRQAANEENAAKAENFNSIAQSSVPGWRSTSETLMAEIQSLLSYTLTNLSEWTLNVAQAEAETYARTARLFEDPAKEAEEAQNEPST